MKLYLKIAAAAAALSTIATPAAAATFSCASNVQSVFQAGSGTVWVTTSQGTFTFCAVTASSNGIAADTCKSWLSMLLTARGLSKQVKFYFDTADTPNANMTSPYCEAANFNWVTRVPYFVELMP